MALNGIPGQSNRYSKDAIGQVLISGTASGGVMERLEFCSAFPELDFVCRGGAGIEMSSFSALHTSLSLKLADQSEDITTPRDLKGP